MRVSFIQGLVKLLWSLKKLASNPYCDYRLLIVRSFSNYQFYSTEMWMGPGVYIAVREGVMGGSCRIIITYMKNLHPRFKLSNDNEWKCSQNSVRLQNINQNTPHPLPALMSTNNTDLFSFFFYKIQLVFGCLPIFIIILSDMEKRKGVGPLSLFNPPSFLRFVILNHCPCPTFDCF